MIIIPDDHEPPIDAGHRSEQTSGTPQGQCVRPGAEIVGLILTPRMPRCTYAPPTPPAGARKAGLAPRRASISWRNCTHMHDGMAVARQVGVSWPCGRPERVIDIHLG